MNYTSFFKKVTKKISHEQAIVAYNESEFLALFNLLKKKGLVKDGEFKNELSIALTNYAEEIEKF